MTSPISDNFPNPVDRWRVSLHEASHLLAAVLLGPPSKLRAELAYHPDNDTYSGLCSSPFGKHTLLTEAVFVAAGKEGARYASTVKPPDAMTAALSATHATPRAAEIAFYASAEGSEFVAKSAATFKTDAECLATIIATVYPAYSDVKHWPKIHRRFRSRARLLLWRHKRELLEIATMIYLYGFYKHDPCTSVPGVNVEKTKKERGHYVTVNQ